MIFLTNILLIILFIIY